MAQTFVGANNINVLRPVGQFGCLSPDTPILLWNGEIKNAEDVIVNDVLIGDDGTPRTVLKTTSGIDTMYEIIDIQNKSVVVNSQHILTLQYIDNFKIKYKGNMWYFTYFDNNTIKQYSVVINNSINDTTYNIFEISVSFLIFVQIFFKILLFSS